MSLSEKAKTTREIKGEIIAAKCQWKDLTLEKRLEKQKWVRLEVAQQEIDRLIAQRNIESGIVDRMQRERGEQKQKLQQFEEFLVAWTENDMKGYIYDYGKKNAHYYPSQDLDLILDFFFELRELLK